MIDEFTVVFNEFLSSYDSISSYIIEFGKMVMPRIAPLFFISVALSVSMIFYRNVVK